MDKVKVGINGYGTIGKRVADAIHQQEDMELIGISKTKPNYEAVMAQKMGYNVYTPSDKTSKMKDGGIKVAGTVEDMVNEADVIVDATPKGVGEKNKELYEKAGVKAIWQGGEDHEVAGFSFNADSNYNDAIGRDYTRVVSCNTTALCRLISNIDREYGVKKCRVTLIRRAADPSDIKKGPINSIVADPVKLPSHHGPDVQSVIPSIDISTMAVKVPNTMMHIHTVNMELKNDCSADDIKNLLAENPRMHYLEPGITSTSETMELARDLGRPRNDMWENCIWEDSIDFYEGELYLLQAVHQEADVVPENIDAIRAMCELEKDADKSKSKTNKAMGIGTK
ncbi:type II glyceraldehyde-3-phosphate dehydrogenase [Methanohalobium sp.]|uniref:type II glyceraldehyde-3-phosphate dehydrogenase n=1 Tax=Methanohalobium sp. TaxID=2837493 RepID=UPI0025DBC687|nr:type II glyceraldehyde-3-phosphate dehydrogenase [Methanohalobium sp.]